MKRLNVDVSEKNQIFHKKEHHQADGVRRSRANSSTRENSSGPQEIRTPSFSGSLSSIWKEEFKHSATYKNNGEPMSENLSLKHDPNDTSLSSSSKRSDISSSMRMTISRYQSQNFDKEDYITEIVDQGTDSMTNYNEKKTTMVAQRTFLPQSAASYYTKTFLPTDVYVTVMCGSVQKLNRYLKERMADIKSGVPGRFLHAVIGPELTGVGSVISTIMYAYFLSKTQEDSQQCTVPVINMKRADLNMHTELKWLLNSCRIEESYLLFIDEIDLSYYDSYGNLKLVLVNGDKLPTKQEGLTEALVEILNCKEVEPPYPWTKVTATKDCSCCTFVAEKFAETTPELLAGHGFSRLMLSGILLDTSNLTDPNCTAKDKYMATLLIKGAGRLGISGLHEMLRYKMFDISELKVRDILRKDFKKWTRVAGKPNGVGSRLTIAHIGMSSIGISIEQLLAHEGDAADEVIQFQDSEKLRVLMIISGYEDSQKNFKREILVSTSTAELMRNFIFFFNAHGAHLPLKPLDKPDLREEIRVFEIDNNMISRRSIERLLEEFGGVIRKQQ